MEVLNIAICDDEEAERELLEKYVEAWASCGNHRISISSFSNGAAFLLAFHEKGFDLALLDIQMQEPDGMCVARQIREADRNIGIFFVTGYEDYLVEGYEVEAFRYLIKPIEKEKLWESLGRFLLRRKQKQRFWTLETPKGQRKVALEDILYLESFGHTCNLYTPEESFPVKIGITEAEKQMAALGLAVFRPHRSYLVNIAQANAVERDAVVLTSGLRVPVSRRLYHALNQAFIRYFRKEHE